MTSPMDPRQTVDQPTGNAVLNRVGRSEGEMKSARESGLLDELSELSSAVANLETSIELMHGRLEPIMVPPPPDAGTRPGGDVPGPPVTRSELAERVHVTVADVYRLTARLTFLRERVDLPLSGSEGPF